MQSKKILVTGGAGFIGSSFAKIAVNKNHNVIILDKLTYSGNIKNILDINHKNFSIKNNFINGDISDINLTNSLFKQHQFDYIVNFAAESHVDNSINNPDPFIETNIIGTYNLLKSCLNYFKTLSTNKQNNFRFLHVSTDEVYGELDKTNKFSETSPYQPNSPYSASKAASDHLVRSYNKTFALPTLITNCSNNYGAKQFPEKLIPFMINRALEEKPLTIYGNGNNVRDWIYVDDHNKGVLLALEKGKAGETYCLGANNEYTNNDLVDLICQILDKIKPRKNGTSYKNLITHIEDRQGHDKRYAIDATKAKKELGFTIERNFIETLQETIYWYLENPNWFTK